MRVATESTEQLRTVIFRFDEKPCRWMLAGLAMHAMLMRDTAVSVELREPAVTNPATVAWKALRYADAMIEVLGQER